MGTRSLTAVFYNGEYRIAQYGQWDGYPGGQGVTALSFARDRLDRDKFLPKLLKLVDMTAEDGRRIDAVEDWPRTYPHLSSDAGAAILDYVQNGDEGMLIKRNINFAGDSLFCEWAYVIDFDKGTFEAFRGFNHKPLDPSERFAAVPLDNPDYQPVRLVKSWPLDSLPTDDQLVKEIDTPDEEEEAA